MTTCRNIDAPCCCEGERCANTERILQEVRYLLDLMGTHRDHIENSGLHDSVKDAQRMICARDSDEPDEGEEEEE